MAQTIEKGHSHHAGRVQFPGRTWLFLIRSARNLLSRGIISFDLSVHSCQKPYIEYKFDVPYFHWYVSKTMKSVRNISDQPFLILTPETDLVDASSSREELIEGQEKLASHHKFLLLSLIFFR